MNQRLQKGLMVLMLSLTIYTVHAQLYLGLSFHADYNLYHWYQQPTTINPRHPSVGQVLNLLPSLGMGVWAGQPDAFLLNIEGSAEYMPFSLDLDGYSGLGALSFPLMARCIIPFDNDEGIRTFAGVGFGVQWSKNGLYRFPNGQVPTRNPFFATMVIEASVGVGAGWTINNKITTLTSFFSRVGIASNQAFSVNFGARVKFMLNPMAKPKDMPSRSNKTYQVSL